MDLGVQFSSNGTFHTHIVTMVKAAQRMSSWVLRTFRTRETGVMKTLLKSMVLPKLEYASPVWFPTDRTSINLIESVQKVFTRKFREFLVWREEDAAWVCDTNYWNRLRLFKLYSLHRRRERFLLLLLYKMIAGDLDPIGFPKEAIKCSGRRNITITPVLSRGGKGRKWVQTLKHNAFPAVAIGTYNLLPAALRVLHANAAAFKSHLDAWLETVPDEPDCSNLRTSAPSNSIADQVRYHRSNPLTPFRRGSI